METSGKDTTDEVMCHYCYEQWDHMMYTQVTSRSDGNRRKRKWSASIQCVYVCVHAHARACTCASVCMWVRVCAYKHAYACTCVCTYMCVCDISNTSLNHYIKYFWQWKILPLCISRYIWWEENLTNAWNQAFILNTVHRKTFAFWVDNNYL